MRWMKFWTQFVVNFKPYHLSSHQTSFLPFRASNIWFSFWSPHLWCRAWWFRCIFSPSPCISSDAISTRARREIRNTASKRFWLPALLTRRVCRYKHAKILGQVFLAFYLSSGFLFDYTCLILVFPSLQMCRFLKSAGHRVILADMYTFQWNAARFSFAVDEWVSLPNFKYDPGNLTGLSLMSHARSQFPVPPPLKC